MQLTKEGHWLDPGFVFLTRVPMSASVLMCPDTSCHLLPAGRAVLQQAMFNLSLLRTLLWLPSVHSRSQDHWAWFSRSLEMGETLQSFSPSQGASLVAQPVKNLPAMRKTRVQSPDWEDSLEKGMSTHSSILAWRIPWREGPGGL